MKRVGASVSIPHSSACAMLVRGVLWRGEVRMARETAALVSARVMVMVVVGSLLFSSCTGTADNDVADRVGAMTAAGLVEKAAVPTTRVESWTRLRTFPMALLF